MNNSTDFAQHAVIETNKVLRNTYLLLSSTLAFSAIMSALAVVMEAPPMGWIALIPSLGLLFLLMWLKNSWLSLPLIFAFTGFMGYFTGPLVSHYLAMPNGTMTVLLALGGTAITTLGLSGYALVTKTDFSFMGGFLFVGLLVLIAAMIALIFMPIPGLHLAISTAAVFIFSGLILFDTSRIIHGGETNYVMATVSLYLDILNMFVHMLHLFGFAND